MTDDYKIRRFSAGDLLDHRGDLLQRLKDSDLFRDLVTGTLVTAYRASSQRSGEGSFDHVPLIIYDHVHRGEIFRVSEDMTELIHHASALLDDTDRWSRDLLPTERGFVRFDRPLVLRDARGNDMLIHALTWGPTQLQSFKNDVAELSATFVTMWNDIQVEPDFYAKQMIADFPLKFPKFAGRWSFIGAEVLVEDSRVGPAMVDPSAIGSRDEKASLPFTNMHRMVMALCMLMNQTIVTTSTERPNTHARRRAKERKLPQRDITVVTLRRRSASTNDDETSESSRREWHHRWVVRGHWRWAKVGAGRQETRRVWVSGHIKGPEDKPLRITQKVYDLKR